MLYLYKANIIRVVDGDTVEATIALGFRVTMDLSCRLVGIDTPEIFGVSKDSEEYAAGMRAKAWLEARVGEKEIYLYSTKFEKYGRALVLLFMQEPAAGIFLGSVNEEMLQLGLAKPYLLPKTGV